MEIELEASLDRWVEAHLLDPRQADRIRVFEQAHAPQSRSRLPILIGLAFGGIMLAAGVLLFISAHWDELSPTQRMTLLVLALAAFHATGAWCSPRFRALSVTLHTTGTVALGGGIFLAGQIFNLQEHWPGGVMLWAMGAAAGWVLLGDWPQLATAAILIPFWLEGEWFDAVPHGQDAIQIGSVGFLLLAISYVTAIHPRLLPSRGAQAGVFNWLGGLALLPAAAVVATLGRARDASTTAGLQTLGWCFAILIPLAFAAYYRRASAWMNVVAAMWGVGLSLLAQRQADAAVYAWCGVGAAGMVAWGVGEFRAERVNLGMAGFAITLLCFFFSNVMDKLGRSASLIALGTLFLAGGWFWERLRRRLVSRALEGAQ